MNTVVTVKGAGHTKHTKTKNPQPARRLPSHDANNHTTVYGTCLVSVHDAYIDSVSPGVSTTMKILKTTPAATVVHKQPTHPRTTTNKMKLPTGAEYINHNATNNATSKSNTQRMPSIKLWMHIKQACARLGNCSMATNAQQQPLAQPTNGHQAHEQRPKHRG